MRVQQRGPAVDEREAAILEAFETIKGYYRNTDTMRCTALIEPAPASLNEGSKLGPILPRLVVQCAWSSRNSVKQITLFYVPTSYTRIVTVACSGGTERVSKSAIQWTSMTDSWSIVDHGPELDEEAHASLLQSLLKL